MLLFSIIFLTVIFIVCWNYIWYLGYRGVFFVIFISLLLTNFISFWNLYEIWFYGYTIEYAGFLWACIGNEVFLYFNLRVDFFNSLLTFVVLSASLIVIFFVFFDMWDDKDGVFFVINLGFFISFMLIVVNSANLLFFYLGWEGISLTSLFLITFWSERTRSVKAAIKVFIINKIGDLFFLILIIFLINFVGDLNFDSLNAFSIFYTNFTLNFFSIKFFLANILGILLYFSSCVKSAQYGFHIWLLEAMEAPLGASALMHSSTLVVAGLILCFKLSILIELSIFSQVIMLLLGAFSSLYASFIAIFQFELKVIMAYSTISNMGYMFILFSIAAYKEVLIIMILHAYIKIYLFLVIGTIMIHCNGMQDLRFMGGLFSYIPSLWISYFLASIGLSGLPFLSGYYYKLELWQNFLNNNYLIFGVEYFIFLSFFFTLVYLFRTGYLIFCGPKNGHRSIYKTKSYSALLICNYFLLSFIILFCANFVNCLLDSNLTNISGSFYFYCFLFYNWTIVNASVYSLYLWTLVYLISFLFFFFLICIFS